MPPKSDSKAANKEKYCQYKLAAVVNEIRGSVGSEGLLRCVTKTLSKDELSSLHESASSSLEHFALDVANRAAGSSAAQEIVVQAAKTHLGGWQKARQVLTVPGRRMWGTVTKNKAKKRAGRKSKVKSQLVYEKVRVYLLENSTVTAKLMKVQDSVRPVPCLRTWQGFIVSLLFLEPVVTWRPVASASFCKVYNLKSSRGRLWARSTAMQSLLSRAVWYRHLKLKHPNFVRLKCRTDVCTFCHKYDKVLLPALKRDLEASRGSVQSAQADYFEALDKHWEAMKADGRTDPDDRCSLQFVNFMKLFMDRRAAQRMREKTTPGTVARRQDLKEAEAAACNTMQKYKDILECCAHHFASVRRQHEHRESLEISLAKDACLIQLDFMENMTWPLGPEEASDWFWATSRESMTTLGFFVSYWRDGLLVKEYYHYISQVLNHDSAFACQCLQLAGVRPS